MERNNQNMHYFNYKNYKALSDAIKNSKDEFATEDLKALSMCLEDFNHYVFTVDKGEREILLSDATGEDYRELVSRYDSARRSAHEAAIASVGMANKLAELYGVGKLFEGDATERLQVADFCLDVVTDIFNYRSM